MALVWKKIGIFCVGTGGHVLPAKNLILQLNDEGTEIELIKDDLHGENLKIGIRKMFLDIYKIALKEVEKLLLHSIYMIYFLKEIVQMI